MDPLIVGSMISAGAGLLGAGMNSGLGLAQSKELMDYQYQLQQKGIEDQRAYNSPQSQMERLRNAGLSPNLVYGNGVDGNQSSAASPSIANRQNPLGGNPLQDAVQQYNVERQLRMQDIKTRNEAFESRERQLKLRAETLGQMLDNSFNDKTMETRIKSLSQKLVNDMQQQKNLEANEALSWSRTRNEDNRLAQIWADVDLLKSRKNLTDEQALTEAVRRRSLEAGIALTEAQTKQVASYIEFIDAGTDLRGQEYDIKELEFESGDEFNKWLKDHPNVEMGKEIFDYIMDKWNGKTRGARRSRGRRRK